ncbi:TfuA-like protein [Pararhizobium sp. DWP1-1-3]|uniref:TfuA-like protein n=1 Tax=Pararhizobium sp. DWP1-1-3 TaxID=2804652 RepID=UPI003CEE626D
MKLLFAGPTLPKAQVHDANITVRGPAGQGDIFRAVEGGATVIGIVDGAFEYTAPVWHKEILYALSAGATVLGAASMGALRAAECHSFGMIGVGRIFKDYLEGIRVDDSDVAQIHGPAELGWLPLSEPLVNVTATLDLLLEGQLLSSAEAIQLQATAEAIFFKARTWRSILKRTPNIRADRSTSISIALQTCRVNQKRADAMELVAIMSRLDAQRSATKPDWEFQRTTLWNDMLKHHLMAKDPGHLS